VSWLLVSVVIADGPLPQFDGNDTKTPPHVPCYFIMQTHLVDDLEVHVSGGPRRLLDEIQGRVQHKVILAGDGVGLVGPRRPRGSRRIPLVELGLVQRLAPSDDDEQQVGRRRHSGGDEDDADGTALAYEVRPQGKRSSPLIQQFFGRRAMDRVCAFVLGMVFVVQFTAIIKLSSAVAVPFFPLGTRHACENYTGIHTKKLFRDRNPQKRERCRVPARAQFVHWEI